MDPPSELLDVLLSLLCEAELCWLGLPAAADVALLLLAIWAAMYCCPVPPSVPAGAAVSAAGAAGTLAVHVVAAYAAAAAVDVLGRLGPGRGSNGS